MKKYLSLVLSIMLAVTLVPNIALAARVGDVIGYAQPTDIVATINGYQLESYNVNGYTYICVEDLRYYGFNVHYDNATRSLSFSRNYGVSYIDPQNSNPNFWAIGSNNTKRKILYTDIVTYANGNYVAASNINGKTIINFNSLSAFGAVSYDNNRREISLVMDGLNYNPIVEVAIAVEEMLVDANRGYSWDIRVRAKGDMITVKQVSTAFNSLKEIGNLSSFSNRVKSGDLYNDYKENLAEIRALGYNVSSFYVEYYTKNGEKIVSTQIY